MPAREGINVHTYCADLVHIDLQSGSGHYRISAFATTVGWSNRGRYQRPMQ